MGDEVVTLFLAGDVMLGRGVDQILPSPGDPTLHEDHMRDARGYVELAERVNGPIPRPVTPDWPWGEALAVLDEAAPQVRVINLETAVTVSDDVARDKAVHYRMHPGNLACLTVARPDVCVLANNHVLDFGRAGLVETLDTLSAAGLTTVGAGRDLEEATRPVAMPLAGGGRVLTVAVGTPSSGIPTGWAARPRRPGVAFLAAPSPDAADGVLAWLDAVRRPGDLAVVSIHWGSNWGYDVPRSHTRFAHALIDGGVDLVHGHSSHHPRPVEVYRDRLILYGCGDLLDDYEGIAGYEHYRDDLRLLYLVSLHPGSGALTDLRIVPMVARRMRLEHASAADGEWIRATLDHVSRPFGVHLAAAGDGMLRLATA